MLDGSAKQLYAAGWVFAAGTVVHIGDHLRRGPDSISEELNALGTFALVVQAAVITLILTRHHRAPLAAAATGFPLALGFLAAHWLPTWGVLSDPVWEIGSWVSYLASAAEIVGALLVGVAGVAVLRHRAVTAS